VRERRNQTGVGINVISVAHRRLDRALLVCTVGIIVHLHASVQYAVPRTVNHQGVILLEAQSEDLAGDTKYWLVV
jgi:ACT domain-containing protein